MKNSLVTVEKIIFALVFLLALISRLWALGDLPLGDVEAALALQAANLFGDRLIQISPEPAYILLTGGLFAFFQATDFLARLIPALAGSALVLVPLLFRRQLGRWSAIILAIGLALDPGLTAVSRQAGGILIGLAGTLFACGFYLKRSASGFGICLALAVLGGPDLLPGWLALGIGIWAMRRHLVNPPAAGEAADVFSWRSALVWAAGTLVAVGTLLLSQPRGLSAAAAGFVAYFQGWGLSPDTTPGQLLLAILFYEFLPLSLGLIGGLRGLFRGDPVDRFLLLWWGVALILALVFPGRQVADLAWSMVPLWGLAARQMARWAEGVCEHRHISAGQAALVAALLTVALVNLATLATRTDLPQYTVIAHWAQLSAALVLAIIITFIIAAGWSTATALDGLRWGVTGVMLVLTLAAMWNASGRGNHPGRELWRIDAHAPQQDLLLDTLDDAADWANSQRRPMDLYVVDGSAALQWALKNYPQTEFVAVVPMDAKPSVVITDSTDAFLLSAPYSGQDFTFYTTPEWTAMVAREWLEWGFYRRAPEYSTQIFVWIRTDLFPGSASNFTP